MNSINNTSHLVSRGLSRAVFIVIAAFVVLIAILVGIYLPKSGMTSSTINQLSTDISKLMEVKPVVVDFRNITSNQDAIQPFTITNPGNQTLHIIDIISSCACLRVEPRKYEIMPGKTVTFKASLVAPPMQNMAVNFELNIYTGPTDPPIIVPVVGEMEQLFFFDTSYNEKNELQAVTIQAKGGDEFAVLEVPPFIEFDITESSKPATSFFLPINTSFKNEDVTGENDQASQLILQHAFHGNVQIFWIDQTQIPKRPDPVMEPRSRNNLLTDKHLKGEEEVEVIINGPKESDFNRISITTASSSPLEVEISGYEIVPGGLKFKLRLKDSDRRWERTQVTFLYNDNPVCVIRLIHPDFEG